jgi:hypothetical protein
VQHGEGAALLVVEIQNHDRIGPGCRRRHRVGGRADQCRCQVVAAQTLVDQLGELRMGLGNEYAAAWSPGMSR